MNIYFTLIVFSLLCFHFILGNFETYYHSINDDKSMNYIKKIKKNIYPIIILLIIIGFIIYYFKEHKEHRKNFSFKKFLFGVIKCDHR